MSEADIESKVTMGRLLHLATETSAGAGSLQPTRSRKLAAETAICGESPF
jgi:hypothetical protein